MKVFLVEDSALLRTRLESLLGSIPGVSVLGYADSAPEAVRRILEERPDVVVLDLHLREGNGLDVLRALRHAAANIATYVLTNYPEERYRRIAVDELGARGFFDKSQGFTELRDALKG
jgi:DNA-binding NarL/FixJ family response regulator